MTTPWRHVLVAALLLTATGCASSSEPYQTTTLVENEEGALNRNASIAVAVAGAGSYIDKPYPGSGAMARAAMVAALSRHTDKVAEILSFVPDDAAGGGALGRNADFLVYLKILHWEERATEWSGKPDRIEVEIRLLNGNDGAVLASRQVTASSSWLTLGGDHPQDLLVKPFADYAAGLFGATTPAAS